MGWTSEDRLSHTKFDQLSQPEEPSQVITHLTPKRSLVKSPINDLI
jgi:hypothetical protein